MTDKDWKEIQKLKLRFTGTKRGIALCRLIEEKQRLDQIRQIVDGWNNDASHSFEDMCKINRILKD